MYFIGGLLKHVRALCAITNPSTNSYKRLLPGFEAPVTVGYATANRSAVIRIPGYVKSPDKVRFELRNPDATCNPYYAYAAILMAGLDGINNKIDPADHHLEMLQAVRGGGGRCAQSCAGLSFAWMFFVEVHLGAIS